MTGFTLQWGRLLRLGAKWDSRGKHWNRVKNSLWTKFCLAPPISGYYKDHKAPVQGREHLGPKLRPVCGAVESSNGPLSHPPPLGTRLVEGVFQVVEELVEEDRQVPEDRRTGEVAKELANTICPYLQMEVDYPSNHSSG